VTTVSGEELEKAMAVEGEMVVDKVGVVDVDTLEMVVKDPEADIVAVATILENVKMGIWPGDVEFDDAVAEALPEVEMDDGMTVNDELVSDEPELACAVLEGVTPAATKVIVETVPSVENVSTLSFAETDAEMVAELPGADVVEGLADASVDNTALEDGEAVINALREGVGAALPSIPPLAPHAAIMESALDWLVHDMN
jgi:hypothetical protein